MKEGDHKDILELIKKHSGNATKHTFADDYLGNNHPRYAISMPALRIVAKSWMFGHRDMDAVTFGKLLTSLAEGESGTEKTMVGILMDYAQKDQKKFNPRLFDNWLDHLMGWAEVDAVCSCRYTRTEIIAQWQAWKPIIVKFSKSKNISKRRACLVLLIVPVRMTDDNRLSALALQVIDRLKHEKEILITKAISWLLRSMIKKHKNLILQYLKNEGENLPKIALRETLVKIKTGIKNKRKDK
ncbi:MAG: DNA alkylation repair protein [Chryseolinea sp.]